MGGTAAPTPEATEIGAYAPDAIPWAEDRVQDDDWALRDWLDLRQPAVRPERDPAATLTVGSVSGRRQRDGDRTGAADRLAGAARRVTPSQNTRRGP